MPAIKINTQAAARYAIWLNQSGRSALPVVCRQTLNRAALDTKTKTMPEEAKQDFVQRKPTFFKATSKVAMATGFDLKTMQSVAGFVAPENKKESGHATQDLEQQEHGGTIDKRAYIYTKKGRTGRGNVKDDYLMAVIKNKIVDANKYPDSGKNDADRYIKAVLSKNFKQKFIIGTTRLAGGARPLLKINSVKKIGRRTVVNSSMIATVKAKRQAKVKATHFMETASVKAAKDMQVNFIKFAEAKFKKDKFKP
jgi:hypothetical protein